MIQNSSRGSSQNENYCFYVQGLNKTVGIIPILWHDLNKPLEWNLKATYLLCLPGQTQRSIAQTLGLVHFVNEYDENDNLIDIKTQVNGSPIRLRQSNA